MKKLFFSSMMLLIMSASLTGATIPVNKWLIAQADVFIPPFANGSFSIQDFAAFDINSLWPRERQTLAWDPSQTLIWKRIETSGGKLSLPNENRSTLVLASTYIEVPRWQKAILHINSVFPFQIFLNGEFIGTEEKTDLTLTRETHRLMIFSIKDQFQKGEIEVHLEIDEKFRDATPIIHSDPMHSITLQEALTIPEAREVELASDGLHVAILDTEGGIEIRKLPNGELDRTIFLPDLITSFSWSQEGSRLAIVTKGEKSLCSMWIVDIHSGSTQKIVSGIEGMSQLQWLPDGKFVAYTATEAPPEKGPYVIVDNFFDRWDGWKYAVSFWLVSVENRTRHMITRGIDPYGQLRKAVLSPNGKKVVFLNVKPSSVYPYRKEELWHVDILSGKPELISEIKTSMISDVIWSPDSTQLVTIAPYYNYPVTQADVENYHSRWHQGIQIWDLSTKSSRYITESEFSPCVRSLWWNPKDRHLYFIALDRTVHRLYRFSNDLSIFHEIKLPFTNIEKIYGSGDSEWAILRLSEIDKPAWLVSINLLTHENNNIWDKGQSFLSLSRLGKCEIFNTENSLGIKIDGWIYWPPGFDPQRKYPAIVSYYGGIGPRTQRFDQINHWLAGNGYVVYQLTPRGAYGYGQAFADAHFNEWGTVSSPDIIDAVKALLKAKPFIDPERIGGYGHSYGGFEGLSLATQTDLFSAIVATGVISNTLNYSFIVLGQPNNGEIALPGVFPWNRRDVYVDRSPVFNADKVTTPILLMQGTDDPWCQMAESDQMYSALKVQGKDVVQIRWIGEAHGIAMFSNRILNERIRVEWFDKYLKDEPESFEERYKLSRR